MNDTPNPPDPTADADRAAEALPAEEAPSGGEPSPAEETAPGEQPAVDQETDPADEPAPADEQTVPGGTSLYVRRSRTPTLGFWVVLALVVPAVAGAAAAPFLGLRDLASVVNLGVVSMLVVGVPLAGAAALIDAIATRRRGRRPSA